MQGQAPNDVNVAVTSSAERLARQNQNAAGAAANGVPAAAANQNQAMVMNAAGGQAIADDDDDLNRDWLDMLYMATRFSLMLTIVYFYSTPARFFVVSVFFCLIYFYQNGYLQLQMRRRRRRLREQQEDDARPHNDVPQVLPAVEIY